MKIHDELRVLARALPDEWVTSPDMETVIRRWAEQRPELFIAPITTAAAAELIGVSAAALRQARFRGDHPDTWCPERRRYLGGRLAVLRWVHTLGHTGREKADALQSLAPM